MGTIQPDSPIFAKGYKPPARNGVAGLGENLMIENADGFLNDLDLLDGRESKGGRGNVGLFVSPEIRLNQKLELLLAR